MRRDLSERTDVACLPSTARLRAAPMRGADYPASSSQRAYERAAGFSVGFLCDSPHRASSRRLRRPGTRARPSSLRARRAARPPTPGSAVPRACPPRPLLSSAALEPDREHRPAEQRDDDEDREGDPGQRVAIGEDVDDPEHEPRRREQEVAQDQRWAMRFPGSFWLMPPRAHRHEQRRDPPAAVRSQVISAAHSIAVPLLSTVRRY